MTNFNKKDSSRFNCKALLSRSSKSVTLSVCWMLQIFFKLWIKYLGKLANLNLLFLLRFGVLSLLMSLMQMLQTYWLFDLFFKRAQRSTINFLCTISLRMSTGLQYSELLYCRHDEHRTSKPVSVSNVSSSFFWYLRLSFFFL